MACIISIPQDFDNQSQQLITQLTLSLRNAFAHAITNIYKYLLFVVLAGLVVAAFIPQLELRKSNYTTPAAAEIS